LEEWLEEELEEEPEMSTENAELRGLQESLMVLEGRGFTDSTKNLCMLQEGMSVEGVASAITAERAAYRAKLEAEEASSGQQELAVPQLQVGTVCRKGIAHANEDRECRVNLAERLSHETLVRLGGLEGMWLWGVFDGHGGSAVAQYTRDRLPEHVVEALGAGCSVPEALMQGYHRAEEEIIEMETRTGERSGTCALVVVMCGTQVHTAHVGDCRAIIASGVTPIGVMAPKLATRELTHDHRGIYPGEKERVIQAGAKLIHGRVNGSLMPSRSLGDLSHKRKNPGAIIAEPSLAVHTLLRADQYLILASDGLWDDMGSERVAGVVRKSTKAQPAADALAREVARKYKGKHMDDFTALVIRFLHDSVNVPTPTSSSNCCPNRKQTSDVHVRAASSPNDCNGAATKGCCIQ